MSAQRHNLCLLTNCFGHGGTELQFAETVLRLNRTKYKVVVACLDRTGESYERVISSGLPVTECPVRGGIGRKLQSAWQWTRLLRNENIELVHTYDFYTNVFGAPLARLARVPVVVTSRRDDGSMWSPARRWALRRAFAWSDMVIANSNTARDGLLSREGLPESRVRVVRNGVDVNRFHPNGHREPIRRRMGSDPGHLLVAVVAHLRPEKDHRTLFEAMPVIVRRVPAVRFLIVGVGPMESEQRRKTDEKNLGPWVSFLGYRCDVTELLAVSDLAVLPTTTESNPNVVLEAMSSGRAVVASAVGGCRELIDSGRTGMLVPARDPHAMAESIIQLLVQPELRESIGRAARRHAEAELSMANSVERLEAVYDDLLERKLGRR